MSVTNRLANAGAVSIVQPRRLTAAMDLVKQWIADGIDIDGIALPTIEKRLGDMPAGETVGSLAYFDPYIRKAHALAQGRKRGGTSRRAATPADALPVQDDNDDRVAIFRDVLRSRTEPRAYDSWLAHGKTAVALNGTSVTIRAKAGFMVEQLSSNFAGPLREAAAAIGLDDITIEGV
jgi:hypothetical protein